MFANVRPLGFLGAAKAQDAEHLIGRAEKLVSILGSPRTELKPVEKALGVAKALYAAQEYSKAVAQARRVAALAMTLTERFNAYVAAWKSLQTCREELQRIGFPTDHLEAALSAADKEVVRMIPEDGTLVPDYAGAAAILDRVMAEARNAVAQARGASRGIFLATLAVEALTEPSSTEAPSWLAIRLEEMVEQATRLLALGDATAAGQIASEASARAEDALAGADRAWEVLDTAAAVLDGLAADGSAANALAERIGAARRSLAAGFPDRTSAMAVARQLSDEVASFARQYPRARNLLERVERVHARFRQDGFSSDDVDAALGEARRALREGDWTAFREKLRRVSHAYLRLRSDQQALSRSISEIDDRVDLLSGFRLPLLPDVEEILVRAKEEVRSGRISGANEDVTLARSLMLQATRTGS